jgi:hypothetical protein
VRVHAAVVSLTAVSLLSSSAKADDPVTTDAALACSEDAGSSDFADDDNGKERRERERVAAGSNCVDNPVCNVDCGQKGTIAAVDDK